MKSSKNVKAQDITVLSIGALKGMLEAAYRKGSSEQGDPKQMHESCCKIFESFDYVGYLGITTVKMIEDEVVK